MGRKVCCPDPGFGNLLVPDCNGLVLSVVSHGQRALLLGLLEDLQRNVKTPFRLIVTENIPEEPEFPVSDYTYSINVVRNRHPKGFGSNHNSALELSAGDWLCVLNPDIRILSDPFPALFQIISDRRIGVVAPEVINPALIPEDHARNFPSVFTLIAKLFGHRPGNSSAGRHAVYYPDWVAGMFMLFRAETLRSLGGFDERYFLYYEDVDLCARLREADYEVAVCPDAVVIHAARRQSRRNLRFASWHLHSALRFFVSQPRIALGLHRRR